MTPLPSTVDMPLLLWVAFPLAAAAIGAAWRWLPPWLVEHDTARTFCEHLAAALLVGAVAALWLALAGYGLWQGGRFALGARADAWPLVWTVLAPTVLVGSVWHAWRNTFAEDEEAAR